MNVISPSSTAVPIAPKQDDMESQLLRYVCCATMVWIPGADGFRATRSGIKCGSWLFLVAPFFFGKDEVQKRTWNTGKKMEKIHETPRCIVEMWNRARLTEAFWLNVVCAHLPDQFGKLLSLWKTRICYGLPNWILGYFLLLEFSPHATAGCGFKHA